MNLPQLPLGVAVMDEDHYALEQMFACTPLIGDKDLSAHLDAIIDALAAHFVREEAAMEAEGAPVLDCHRGQHVTLLQEAARLREAFAEADAPTRRRVISFRLARLMADHVASIDAISANFFAHKINYAQEQVEITQVEIAHV